VEVEIAAGHIGNGDPVNRPCFGRWRAFVPATLKSRSTGLWTPIQRAS